MVYVLRNTNTDKYLAGVWYDYSPLGGVPCNTPQQALKWNTREEAEKRLGDENESYGWVVEEVDIPDEYPESDED